MKDDFEEEHFQTYNIIDRLREECQRQYGSLYKAAKAYGSPHLNRYLNTGATHLGLVLLLKICKFLDVSLQWAVFGGKKDSFIDQNITLNNFYKEYKEANKGNCDHNVYVCWWNFKHGRRASITLKYLIKTAKKSRKTIDYLIGG